VSHPIPVTLVRLSLFTFALCLLSQASSAQAPETPSSTTPVQFALWHPIQVFGEDVSVTGLRLVLISGVNQDVTGLDLLGLASLTRGNQTGLQLGLYDHVGGDLTGWQVGVFANDVNGRARGFQGAGLANRADHGIGFQFAALLNKTKRMRGLQISLVNWTEELEGAQLGLININRKGPIPFLPIFNFGF
jgi:hypothetical protein